MPNAGFQIRFFSLFYSDLILSTTEHGRKERQRRRIHEFLSSSLHGHQAHIDYRYMYADKHTCKPMCAHLATLSNQANKETNKRVKKIPCQKGTVPVETCKTTQGRTVTR